MKKFHILTKPDLCSGYYSGSTSDSESAKQDRYFLPKWRTAPSANQLPLPSFFGLFPKLV